LQAFSSLCRPLLATPSADLDAALDAAHVAAHAAWPAIDVDDAKLAAQLSKLLAGEADPVAALAKMHVADVYLTVACADGNAEAIAVIENQFVPDLRSTLSRMRLTASAIDEALQVMREELFVPRAGASARILNYGGRGQLRGWLRSVAARTGLRGFRHKAVDEIDDRIHASPVDDLELDYLKRTYGEAFRSAFQTAVAELDADDRVLLKQRFRHGLGVEELGAMHGVHAGTISRRVAAARERLVAGTHKAMMRELDVAKSEVSSIMRLIHSQMEISLSTFGESMPERDG
jgi:RNA polymerase sigma-70 factor (ECF subfamily)